MTQFLSLLRAQVLTGVFLFVGSLSAAETNTISDFTFIQTSDIHAPRDDSKRTIAKLKNVGEIQMTPFKITVPKPDFAIATGDLNEFGGGRGWWEEGISYWKETSLPLYPALGNHDNTWHANIKQLRELVPGFGPWYSYDRHGCHFVALMSATPQDPRPSFGEEELLWLKSDLAKVGTNTPVFVYFHHPLPGPEFASRYDSDRLADILHDYNTALILAGHTHNYAYNPFQGIDQITGGSTFGPNSGWAVISVKSNVLHAAYWKTNETTPSIKLFRRPISAKPVYPRIQIASPKFRSALTDTLSVTANLSGKDKIEKAIYTIDDEITNKMSLVNAEGNWTATATVNLTNLKNFLPGAHYLRVEFHKGSRNYSRSTEFFFDSPKRPIAWRTYLASSSKVTPAVSEGVVYVGANDGIFRALNVNTGKTMWSVPTGSEILTEPLVVADNVYFANGMGEVFAYNKTGTKVWSFKAGDAVYSSPVFADRKICFGCNDGKFYAVDAATGKLAWQNADAGYAIESKPFVFGNKIYFGAWDEQIRCVNPKDGQLVWKQAAEGTLHAPAKRYYSPGDAMPVVVNGKLMIADRAYALSILNANDGARTGSARDISATGVSEDGNFAYLRKVKGSLAKISSSGTELWSTTEGLNAIPTAPIEKNGVVYACSGRGTVTAASANSGEILWQYQASPQLFVMSNIACDGTNAYVTAFDGTLAAIRCKAQ